MIAFKVYGYFFKSLFLRFFTKKKQYRLSIDTLFSAHTYRTPANLNRQKAPFLYYLKSIKYLFLANSSGYKTLNNQNSIYCLTKKHAEICIEYTALLNLKPDNINVIVRDCPLLDNMGIINKALIVSINFFICAYAFIISFFNRDSNKLAILTLELTESCALLNVLLKSNSNYVYYFSAYEKDANWVALLLQRNRIYCHKIPSSNPIKNFYSSLLCDKFSFTAPFQVFEYPNLKANWLVNSYEICPNFGAKNLYDYRIEDKGSPPLNSIGLYTRGIWLRKLRGDNFLGVGEDDAELKMLEFIRKFLREADRKISLTILLHPVEKSNHEQYEKSKLYYSNYFEGFSVNFADSTLGNYQLFNSFDVGIASISSIIFERLYCGYKCLLAPINLKVKLYEDVNLENVIAINEDEFYQKLSTILELSASEFFSLYNLNDYRSSEVKQISLSN